MHAVSWQVEQSLKSWPVLKHLRLQRRARGNAAEKNESENAACFQPLSRFPNCSQETFKNAELYHTVHSTAEKMTRLATLNIVFNHLYSFTRLLYKSFSLTLC